MGHIPWEITEMTTKNKKIAGLSKKKYNELSNFHLSWEDKINILKLNNRKLNARIEKLSVEIAVEKSRAKQAETAKTKLEEQLREARSKLAELDALHARLQTVEDERDHEAK